MKDIDPLILSEDDEELEREVVFSLSGIMRASKSRTMNTTIQLGLRETTFIHAMIQVAEIKGRYTPDHSQSKAIILFYLQSMDTNSCSHCSVFKSLPITTNFVRRSDGGTFQGTLRMPSKIICTP
jgi:hypothetical protein